MIFSQKAFLLLTAILCICASSLSGADDAIEPVTPNASPEARALLEFLYSTSGKYTETRGSYCLAHFESSGETKCNEPRLFPRAIRDLSGV